MREVKMEQRKLTDQANTVADLAKVCETKTQTNKVPLLEYAVQLLFIPCCYFEWIFLEKKTSEWMKASLLSTLI